GVGAVHPLDVDAVGAEPTQGVLDGGGGPAARAAPPVGVLPAGTPTSAARTTSSRRPLSAPLLQERSGAGPADAASRPGRRSVLALLQTQRDAHREQRRGPLPHEDPPTVGPRRPGVLLLLGGQPGQHAQPDGRGTGRVSHVGGDTHLGQLGDHLLLQWVRSLFRRCPRDHPLKIFTACKRIVTERRESPTWHTGRLAPITPAGAAHVPVVPAMMLAATVLTTARRARTRRMRPAPEGAGRPAQPAGDRRRPRLTALPGAAARQSRPRTGPWAEPDVPGSPLRRLRARGAFGAGTAAHAPRPSPTSAPRG